MICREKLKDTFTDEEGQKLQQTEKAARTKEKRPKPTKIEQRTKLAIDFANEKTIKGDELFFLNIKDEPPHGVNLEGIREQPKVFEVRYDIGFYSFRTEGMLVRVP